jgi:hypothetical protein
MMWLYGLCKFNRTIPFAAFASMRLGNNSRLNEGVNFSPRRKDAK